MRYKYQYGLISAVTLISILYNIYTLLTFHPVGFNIDFYSQYPVSFWFVLFMIYFMGVLLIFQKEKIFYKTGAFAIVTNFITFLLAPYGLGYFTLFRCDGLSDLGEIANILRTGYIDVENIYPAMFLLHAQLALLCDQKINILAQITPLFFSLIFMSGLIIVSRRIIKTHNIYPLVLPISSIFFARSFHFSITPQFMFYSLLPIFLFILYIYMEDYESGPAISIALIAIIIAVSIGHPFIAISAMFIIVLLSISLEVTKTNYRKPYTALIILVVVFGVWCIYNVLFVRLFPSYWAALVYHTSKSMAEVSVGQELPKTSFLSLALIIKIIFLMYGRYFIPLIVIIASLLFVWRRDYKEELIAYKKCISIFILLSLVDATFIFNKFYAHTLERLSTLNYFVFPLVILFVLSLNVYILNNTSVGRPSLMVAIILTFIFTISVYGAYPSPLICQANQAITYNELFGMQWLFDKKSIEPIIDATYKQTGVRFNDYFYGWSNKSTRRDIPQIQLPDHFGYNNQTLALPYHKGYLIIMNWEEELYNQVPGYIDAKTYTANDFSKLKNDRNINKILDDRNIEVYRFDNK